MRVAYLVPWRGGLQTGPFKKVAAQVSAWSELGLQVGLFVATSPDSVADWRSLGHPGLVTAPVGGPLVKLRERRVLTDALLAWAPEVVYERHGLWTPSLTRMARAAPTVIEINGDDLREFALQSKAKDLYNRATRGIHLRGVVGQVHVTRELSLLASYTRFGQPTLVVGNGIDLGSVPELPPSEDPRPGLVWLGDPRSPFQGLDDTLALARARPQWRIDIVGPTPRGPADRLDSVTWHAAGPPSSYHPVLARADIGIGTLDAHRTGMQEASSLKVREYLALGLPVVIGYRDTDIPAPVPHVLQVPNRPGGILESMPELDAFVDRWKGRRVPRTEIGHLDVAVKERARVEFLRQVADRAGRS